MRTTHEELARQLWAVGDLARLRVLQLLPDHEDCQGGNNVSALAAKLGLAQPTISHHLRVLRQAGLVRNRKMCRDVFYWVDPVAAERVLEALRVVLRTAPEAPTEAALPTPVPRAPARKSPAPSAAARKPAARKPAAPSAPRKPATRKPAAARGA